jgi:hypothetical protein
MCLYHQLAGEEALKESEFFQNNLFLMNITNYITNLGVLVPLLSTCTAAAIMYHQKMVADCGTTDAMVDKMIQTVIKLSISHDLGPK